MEKKKRDKMRSRRSYGSSPYQSAVYGYPFPQPVPPSQPPSVIPNIADQLVAIQNITKQLISLIPKIQKVNKNCWRL